VGRIYNEKNYEKADIVVYFCHQERYIEIRHEKKLKAAKNKNDK
jgi:hypothetical protein